MQAKKEINLTRVPMEEVEEKQKKPKQTGN